MSLAGGRSRLLVLVALASLAALPFAASATAGGHRAPRYCGVVYATDFWTPPFATIKGHKVAGRISPWLSCSATGKLVKRWIAQVRKSFPHSKRRGHWSCRLVYTLGGPAGDCKRRRKGRVDEVFFTLGHRLLLDLTLKTDGCAAEAQPGVEASNRPLKADYDYGGPGDYNPDVNSSTLGDPWVYDQAGTYTVRVIVTDARGKQVSGSRTINVSDDSDIPCGSGGVHDSP